MSTVGASDNDLNLTTCLEVILKHHIVLPYSFVDRRMLILDEVIDSYNKFGMIFIQIVQTAFEFISVGRGAFQFP